MNTPTRICVSGLAEVAVAGGGGVGIGAETFGEGCDVNSQTPNELADEYDPTEILEHFIKQFVEDPRMRQDKGSFILVREMGDSKTNLGWLTLTCNCPLIHNKDRWWHSTPRMDHETR